MIALCWVALGLLCAAPLVIGAIEWIVEGLKDLKELFDTTGTNAKSKRGE